MKHPVMKVQRRKERGFLARENSLLPFSYGTYGKKTKGFCQWSFLEVTSRRLRRNSKDTFGISRKEKQKIKIIISPVFVGRF